MSTVFGGHSHADSDVGVDADGADIGVADADVGVGDVDVGDIDVDVGDLDVGHAELGELDMGGIDAHDGFEMGHDFDHALAEAGGDGHVEVGISDAFPGLSPWSPTVLCSFISTFGAFGYISMHEGGTGIPVRSEASRSPARRPEAIDST